MVDVAKYANRGLLTVPDCEAGDLEKVKNTFMEMCKTVCEENGLNAEVVPETFKTTNMARKLGGPIGFVAKLAQNAKQGFTIRSKEAEYKIHFVADQYQDEVSFELFFFTGFSLYEKYNPRKYQYCASRFEAAQECVKEAWERLGGTIE